MSDAVAAVYTLAERRYSPGIGMGPRSGKHCSGGL
jgi:hypothetical protein